MAAGILKMALIEFRGDLKLCGPPFCFVLLFLTSRMRTGRFSLPLKEIAAFKVILEVTFH